MPAASSAPAALLHMPCCIIMPCCIGPVACPVAHALSHMPCRMPCRMPCSTPCCMPSPLSAPRARFAQSNHRVWRLPLSPPELRPPRRLLPRSYCAEAEIVLESYSPLCPLVYKGPLSPHPTHRGPHPGFPHRGGGAAGDAVAAGSVPISSHRARSVPAQPAGRWTCSSMPPLRPTASTPHRSSCVGTCRKAAQSSPPRQSAAGSKRR